MHDQRCSRASWNLLQHRRSEVVQGYLRRLDLLRLWPGRAKLTRDRELGRWKCRRQQLGLKQTRSFHLQWFRPQARHGYEFHHMIFLRELKPVGPDEPTIEQQEKQTDDRPVAARRRTP